MSKIKDEWYDQNILGVIVCDVVTVTLEVEVPRGTYFPESIQLSQEEKDSAIQSVGALDAYIAEVEWQVMMVAKNALTNLGANVTRGHASSLGNTTKKIGDI